MIDELAQVGVGRGDLGVTRRGGIKLVTHGPAERNQIVASLWRHLGQQVGRVVLKVRKEEVKVAQVVLERRRQDGGHLGVVTGQERGRDFDRGEGNNGSVGQAWHGRLLRSSYSERRASRRRGSDHGVLALLSTPWVPSQRTRPPPGLSPRDCPPASTVKG